MITLYRNELSALRRLIHAYGQRSWKRRLRQAWDGYPPHATSEEDRAAMQYLRNRQGGGPSWLARVRTFDILDEAAKPAPLPSPEEKP